MTDNSNDQKKRYTLFDPQEVFDFHLSKNEESLKEFRQMFDAEKHEMAMWDILDLELMCRHEKMGRIVLGNTVENICRTLMTYFRKEGPTKKDRENLAADLFKQLAHLRMAMVCVSSFIPPVDFEKEAKAFREEFAAWKAKNDAAKNDAAKNDNV